MAADHTIRCYEDFVDTLIEVGFSMSGGSNEGIFSVIPWSWNETPPYDTPVAWHTGDHETDPWEWRIRVLDERTDIAYSKVFFRKGGFITREWAPYFLAIRRENRTLQEAYEDGLISYLAKQIYTIIAQNEPLPLHAVKKLMGIKKEDVSKFDRAVIELQMRLYITMCGTQQRVSGKGELYGWSATVFCTTETFWGEDVFAKAEQIAKADALKTVRAQILKVNPDADEKKMLRFMEG